MFATVERKRGRDGTSRPTGRPLNPRMVTRVFRRYATRAGLPPTIRLHDLRHTAITNAISQGEDILLIAAFAGHAKTSTTVDIYGHLMPDRVRQAAERMRSISWAGTESPVTDGQQTADAAVSATSASSQPADREPFFPKQRNSITPNAPGPEGPGATGSPHARRADAGPPADRSQHGAGMTRRFVRQAEASSTYTTTPLGRGATARAQGEKATSRTTQISEQADTDHGANLSARLHTKPRPLAAKNPEDDAVAPNADA